MGRRQGLREMWEPMVIGKFGERYARQVNMAWMWARLQARTTRLATYEGGFQAFADDVAAKLSSMGVEIRYNTPVNKIASGFERRGDYDPPTGERTLRPGAGHLVPGAAGEMAPDLPENYLKGLLELKSHGRGGDGALAQAPALEGRLLLVQPAQGGGLSLPGAGGAHQFRLPETISTASTSSIAAITWKRTTSISL